jgi:hypothetical protein
VTGSLLGTPSYMSPEQARGGKIDGRSDLFSVGCILYEMVAGQRAFRGESITALLFKIITEEPPSLRELDPTVSDAMLRIIGKALSKAPETRYQTGRELADDLIAITQPGFVPTLRTQETPTTLLPPDTPPGQIPTLQAPPTAQQVPTIASQATKVAGQTPTVIPPIPPPVAPTVLTPAPPKPPAPPPLPKSAAAAPAARAQTDAQDPTQGRRRRDRDRPRGRGRAARRARRGRGLLPAAQAGRRHDDDRRSDADDPRRAADDPGLADLAHDDGGGDHPCLSPRRPSPPARPRRSRRAWPRPARRLPPRPLAPSLRRRRPPRKPSRPPAASRTSTTSPRRAPTGAPPATRLAQKYRSDGSSSYTTGRFKARPNVPRGITREERPAVATLVYLNSVQQAYHGRTGKWGTLRELHDAGLLVLDVPVDATGFRRARYGFQLSVESDGFKAEAVPQGPIGRPFVVDDTGKVRFID